MCFRNERSNKKSLLLMVFLMSLFSCHVRSTKSVKIENSQNLKIFENLQKLKTNGKIHRSENEPNFGKIDRNNMRKNILMLIGRNNNHYKHASSSENVLLNRTLSDLSHFPNYSFFEIKKNNKNNDLKTRKKQLLTLQNKIKRSYNIVKAKGNFDIYNGNYNHVYVTQPDELNSNKEPPKVSYKVQEEFTPVGAQVGNLSKFDFSGRQGHSNEHQIISYVNLKQKNIKDSWRYQLLAEKPPDLFEVNPFTGVISTKKNLDRESIKGCRGNKFCEVVLVVGLYGVETIQMIKVSIEILDINDNRPYFKQQKVYLNISESSALNNTYLLPSAIDLDSPVNGVSSYTLLDSSNTFSLQQNKHKISFKNFEVRLLLKKKLDRESIPSYFISLKASDPSPVILPSFSYFSDSQKQRHNQLSPPSNTIDIEISVLDSNDNRPRFFNEPYEKSVPEGLKLHTKLLKVEAADADHGANGHVTFSFSRQTNSLHGNFFAIDSENGEISLKGNLDYEKTQKHQLVVIAKDHGKNFLTAETVVLVKVIDENDNVPSIKIHTANVGDIRGSANEYSDESDNLIFKANTPWENIGAKNFQKGKNFTNYETNDLNNQKKIYRDWFVNHTGQAISFERLIARRTEVFEDAVLFTFAAHVHVNDPDAGFNGETNCSLVQLDASQTLPLSLEQFAMLQSKPSSGNHLRIVKQNRHEYHVETATLFDREKNAQYTTIITCQDLGTPPKYSQQVLIVDVLDVNDCVPTFEKQHYNATMLENNSINSSVLYIKAFDNDIGNNSLLKYSFFKEASGFFHINEQTGSITAIKSIDRERFKSFRFTVLAEDQGTPALTGSCFLEIHIKDTNDQAPKFTQSHYYFNVTENNPEGVAIGYVVASDNDSDAFNSFAFSFLVPPTLNQHYAAKLQNKGYFKKFENQNKDDELERFITKNNEKIIKKQLSHNMTKSNRHSLIRPNAIFKKYTRFVKRSYFKNDKNVKGLKYFQKSRINRRSFKKRQRYQPAKREKTEKKYQRKNKNYEGEKYDTKKLRMKNLLIRNKEGLLRNRPLHASQKTHAPTRKYNKLLSKFQRFCYFDNKICKGNDKIKNNTNNYDTKRLESCYGNMQHHAQNKINLRRILRRSKNIKNFRTPRFASPHSNNFSKNIDSSNSLNPISLNPFSGFLTLKYRLENSLEIFNSTSQ